MSRTEWFNATTGCQVEPPEDLIYHDTRTGRYGFVFDGEITPANYGTQLDAEEELLLLQAKRDHPVAFEHEGIRYRRFTEAGAFLGVDQKRAALQVVLMDPRGEPEQREGKPDVGLVTRLPTDLEIEPEQLLAVVNAIWGADFAAADFEIGHQVIRPTPGLDSVK
jgi:hypothetical protein